MLNVVIVTGRLTKDVEKKSYEVNKEKKGYVIGSIAVPCGKDKTDFFNFSAFSNSAKVLNDFTHKGSLVTLRGRLMQKTWETKEGNKASSVEITVDGVDLLDSAPKDEEPKKEEKKLSKKETVNTDDLPF